MIIVGIYEIGHPEMEQKLGTTRIRIIADRCYSGLNAPETHHFKVYIAE